MENIAIIGAGNGGLALAAELKLIGHTIHLYDKFPNAIEGIIAKGGIQLRKPSFEKFVPLDLVSTQIDEVIRGCSIIFVITPAFAHSEIAQRLADHLEEEQIIILQPGRTGGALEVKNILKQNGKARNIVAETQTLLYACRRFGNNGVQIYGTKKRVGIAALPTQKTDEVSERLNRFLPHFEPMANVLYTSLHNIGAIFHPAPFLFNIGQVERNKSFKYYHEGITPSLAKIIEKMDEERLAVAKRLGVHLPTALDWICESYDLEAKSLYEAIQKNPYYSEIMAPLDIYARYITEDVPMSLVPISDLGRLIEVKTPIIDSVIDLASTIHMTNYRETGRNLSKLGLNEEVDSLWKALEIMPSK